ncbi:MAG: hypothetical protein AAF799_16430 [Myxococcota bacterium]
MTYGSMEASFVPATLSERVRPLSFLSQRGRSGSEPRRASGRRAKKRFRRSVVRRADQIGAAEWERLMPKLVSIYQERFGGLDAATIADEIVWRGEQTHLVLLYGPEGELGGFASFCPQRIEVDGRSYHVFDSGAFARKGYSGANERLARHLLLGGLREKIRRPWLRMHFVVACASPAAYRLLARNAACMYPRHDLPCPPVWLRLVQAVSEARGMQPVEGEPRLVHHEAIFRDPVRSSMSHTHDHDPHVEFFKRINPRYTEPRLLLTHVPLTLGNLVASCVPALRPAYLRWLRRPKR